MTIVKAPDSLTAEAVIALLWSRVFSYPRYRSPLDSVQVHASTRGFCGVDLFADLGDKVASSTIAYSWELFSRLWLFVLPSLTTWVNGPLRNSSPVSLGTGGPLRNSELATQGTIIIDDCRGILNCLKIEGVVKEAEKDLEMYVRPSFFTIFPARSNRWSTRSWWEETQALLPRVIRGVGVRYSHSGICGHDEISAKARQYHVCEDLHRFFIFLAKI